MEEPSEPIKNITIEEFRVKLLEDLEKFITLYKEDRQNNPSEYPEKQWYSDWREQFDTTSV